MHCGQPILYKEHIYLSSVLKKCIIDAKKITLEEDVSKGARCVSPVLDSEAFALSCLHADSFPAASAGLSP